MDLRERLQGALGTRYALERELGQGGMSTVYLAHDPRHDRKVAMKLLRPELAAALGPERFSREIRIAARLQHPHILPLLDSGEAGGFLFYVMPYVEGQSLRDRLAREGELPIHDAVRILVEITDALAHAHEHGVVHRDIKPDNVMLSGRHALVTDFGVAKALADSQTSSGLTSAGVALGTPSYMAPEQASADPALDHRVDVYAVGVVGYEMLAGRPPFAGLTPQQTLAAHLTEEPAPIARLRPAVPSALAAVLMRCLAKHPADRWQSAAELLAQLEPLLTPSGGTTPAETRPLAAVAGARRRRWVPAGLVAGALAVLAGAAVVLGGPGERERLVPGRRIQVTLDPGMEIDPALSPDGRLLAYATGQVGDLKLYVRQLEGGNLIPITGDREGDFRKPSWSPDGSRIAYQSPRGIEVVPALGGRARVLLEVTPPDTAADVVWSPDGNRIAARVGNDLLVRPVSGGAPRRLVTGAYEPHSLAWSPDGRWIAYVSGNLYFHSGNASLFGNIAPSTIMLVPVEGGSPVALTEGPALNTSPVWLPSGRELLFVSSRDGGRDVYRVSLAPDGRTAGPPERLTTGLDPAGLSLSADGRLLAYSAFTQISNVYAVPVDAGPVSVRQARQITTGNQLVETLDLSPDGRWLAYDTDRNGNQDIYRMPLSGGQPEQLVSHPQDDFAPVFSPDGREIAFHTFLNGNRDIYLIPAAGGEPRPAVVAPSQDRDAFFSPDGSRLFFSSDRTGRFEVYAQPRDGEGWGPPQQLTDEGGIFPLASPDGRLLLILHRDRLGTVPAAGGPTTDIILSGPLAGREPAVLISGWGPDSRTVVLGMAAEPGGEQGIWLVPVAGGTPRLLLRVDDPRVVLGRGSMLVRSGLLYFLLLRSESDIWTMELSGR